MVLRIKLNVNRKQSKHRAVYLP